MRPASHREQIFPQRCGNCFFAHAPYFKREHLLCFHGDNIDLSHWRHEGSETVNTDVRIDGNDVGLMEGEEYSEVWGGRVVDDLNEVCDEWKPEEAVA